MPDATQLANQIAAQVLSVFRDSLSDVFADAPQGVHTQVTVADIIDVLNGLIGNMNTRAV